MPVQHKLITVFISIFLAAAASGQQAVQKKDSLKIDYYFDPVVVTATKLKNTSRDIAASISVINAAMIEKNISRSALTIAQEYVPSLYISEWGLMGYGAAGKASGKIAMRGAGGGANTHVLILRNGRPDFMGLMGCTLADDFSADGVGRIEIIRGPGSFLYGTNATGGIINILPKTRESNGRETHVSLGTGSFRSRQYRFEHGGRGGRFDYYVTAGRRSAEGYRPDSDYEGTHLTLHAGMQAGSGIELEMNANLADVYLLDPGTVAAPQTDNWYDIRRWGGDLNLSGSSGLGDTRIKLYANFGKHTFFDGWNSDDRLWGFMAHHTFKPGFGNTTTAGFDYKRYGGRAVDAATDYGTMYLYEYAPYIHTQQLLLRKMILSGGLRTEYHQLYGWEVLPKIGLTWHPGQTSAVRISAAKGFRSPSIRELYFWMPANESLTPDRVWNYEAGVSLRPLSWLTFEGTAFYSRGTNLIQLGSPPPQWVNSGEYTHPGVELQLKMKPSAGIHGGAAWSYLKHDESTFNVPGQKLTAWCGLSLERFTLRAHVKMIGDLTGADFPGPGPLPRLHPLEDYTVLDLSLFIGLGHGTELRTELKNVFDEQYQSMWGYPMPGRNIVAELRYSFPHR